MRIERWGPPLAIGLTLASVVMGVGGLLLKAELVRADLGGVPFFAFGIVGAVVAVRRPRNPIGWLFMPWLTGVALALVPISAAVAIFRYRLYDIDLVINRALVYAVLSAILAGAYLGAVVLLQSVFAPFTQDSDLAVAGSTLAVAALFGPLRGRVQEFIDRRFYRHKYDATETLEEFATSLRDEVDLHSLSRQLVGVVSSSMQPAHASLWLRPSPGGGLS